MALPEEVCGAGKFHELICVKGLRICDVNKRICGIHEEWSLAQQRSPYIILVVEIRPHDSHLIESRQRRHHVCNSNALVCGLSLHRRIHSHELEYFIFWPHKLAGPSLLIAPPL